MRKNLTLSLSFSRRKMINFAKKFLQSASLACAFFCLFQASNATTYPANNTNDQRGFTRPAKFEAISNAVTGDGSDIGAFEVQDPCAIFSGSIAYVNGAILSSGSGESWATAFKTLQEAITTANSCSNITQIWVAAGIYKPTQDPSGNSSPADPRDKTFYLKDGVKIYGGFAGTESLLTERNVAINTSTLSGDLNGDDVGFANNGENAYHVVLTVLDGAATELDGFTIKGGNANGVGFIGVKGYNIYQSNGGGMENRVSSLIVSNCRFIENAGNSGGGLSHSNGSSATIINCIFSGNNAEIGAGILNSGSSPEIINCTIVGNNASILGGGVYNLASSAVLKNCIIWGNSSGVYVASDTPVIEYSIVQGGYAGTGNLDLNPGFVSVSDFHLQICSPAIDAGTALGAPVNDIEANIRPVNAGIDMGAYEFQGSVISGSTLHVNITAPAGGNGRSWSCAFQNLQDAINAASSGNQIWVAAGIYKPTQDPSGNSSPADPRDKTFYLKDGVKIYGGFAGTETLLSERNASTNTTTLSGDLNGDDAGFANNGENAYHVVLTVWDGSATELDGFTIKGGNAYGDGFIGVEGQSIFRFYGGGMENRLSSLKVSNCSFIENTGNSGSGLSHSAGSSATITNCIFSGNHADIGGGILNSDSSPEIINCTISGNTAAIYGGGVYNLLSSAVLKNCIIWGNNSGIYDASSTPIIEYSIVQGGYSGIGNLDVNPSFVSAANLHLQGNSPAINTGTNIGAPSTDIEGTSRPLTVLDPADMGAYEYVVVPGPTTSALSVNGSSSICNGTSTNLLVNITGGNSPFSVVYSDGTDEFTIPNYTSGADILVSPAITTTYSLVSVTDAFANVGTDNSGTPTITVTEQPTWFLDADGDGYYVSSTQSCESPGEGYTTTGLPGDCNDNPDAGGEVSYPGATEICDGIDNNCDGQTDEGFTNTDGDSQADCRDRDDDNDGTSDGRDCAPLDATKWRNGDFYVDADGDGYGTGDLVSICFGATTPAGYSTVDGDCNDDPNAGGAAINPGATEICDGIDNNCDGQIDGDCEDADDDHDGTPNLTDCAPLDETKWRTGDFYTDADSDGFGTGHTVSVCYGENTPSGYSTVAGDCNDGNDTVFPNAPELCDGLDNNCDGTIESIVAICKDASITIENGTATLSALAIDNGSNSPICGIKSLELSKTNFTCADIGANIVVLTVTDNNNNTATCEATVTVVGESPTCSITSIPTSNVYTGGVPTNIYLGYGAQSTKLQTTVPASGGPFTYAWSPATGLSNTASAAPIFTPTTGGTYTFTVLVTNKYGCTTTCSIRICVLDVRVPNSKGKKIYICHMGTTGPTTLEINTSSVSTHIFNSGHGDKLGKCGTSPCGSGRLSAENEVVAEDETVNSVQIAPNPAKDFVTLKMQNMVEGVAQFDIRNTIGKLLQTESRIMEKGYNEATLNIQKLPAGMHFIQIKDAEKKTVVVKLVKY